MIGDQLLVAIARRLESCLRPEDTVARLGGDEFTILLENTQDINNVTLVVERIQTALSRAFKLDGHEVVTTASIGITLSAPGYQQPEDLLRDADIAMYQAKTQGRDRYQRFNTAMHTQILDCWQLETSLRRALEQQQFSLYYQPTVWLATGQITGFEALLYWNHPSNGLVSAAEFVPVAEETGLIIPIGQWVLHEACHQMQSWQEQLRRNAQPRFTSEALLPTLTISVSLSGKQFSQPNLIEQVQQVLQETGLQASALKLEITESVMTANAESDREKLLQLKALGAQLYIDAFGTGYSSLSRLQRLPIDALKIDRSFVSRMSGNNDDAEIVPTIVTLAYNLKLDVVAEGVESTAQVAQLRQLGCEYAQGYFFSRPLDSKTAGNLIQPNNPRPSLPGLS